MNKYKWKLFYKPPIEDFREEDTDTWYKLFYISKRDCKEELDLILKINELIQDYNMNKDYLTLEEIDNN